MLCELEIWYNNFSIKNGHKVRFFVYLEKRKIKYIKATIITAKYIVSNSMDGIICFNGNIIWDIRDK